MVLRLRFLISELVRTAMQLLSHINLTAPCKLWPPLQQCLESAVCSGPEFTGSHQLKRGRTSAHTHTPWAGTLSWARREVRGCHWGPHRCALRWGWQGAPGSKRAAGSGFPTHRSILSKYLRSETSVNFGLSMNMLPRNKIVKVFTASTDK